MINVLSFLPKEYTQNKILKKIENIAFYIMLFLWGIWSFLCSDFEIEEMGLYLFIFIIVEVALSGKLYLDIRDLLLVVGMFVYFVIDKKEIAFQSTLIIFEFYFLGKSLVLNSSNYKKRIILIFTVLAIAMAIGSILDFTSFKQIEGVRVLNWDKFWVNEERYCTQYAFYVIPVSCLIFWALCSFSKHIVLSFSIFILAAICNLNMMKSYTRMNAIIVAMVFFATAVMFLFKNFRRRKVRLIYLIGAVLVAVGCISVVSFVVHNQHLLDLVSKTLNRDNGIVGNIRFSIMKDVLSQLPSHPWGGIYTETGFNAHNVWLDIAKRSGIIPFIITAVYSVYCLYDVYLCVRNAKAKDKIKCEYFIVALFIGLHLYYMIECALISSIFMWAIGCMVSGCIRAINIQGKLEAKKQKSKKRKVKKAHLATALAILTLSISGCTSENVGEIDDEEFEEYIDDGEYDDIALIGEGTEDNPYLINDYNDLIYFYNSVNTGWLYQDKYILQTDDIDMTDVPFWPIAEYNTPYSFLGTYDGGGHVIENIYITTEYYSAVFGKLGGTVMNLGITDGFIDGWKSAGLVGICTSDDAKILNCYVVTTIDGNETAGVVVSGAGMIMGCYAHTANHVSERNENWQRIISTGTARIDGCYSTLVGTDVVDFYYKSSYPLKPLPEDVMSMDETVEALNSFIYEMSYYSGYSPDAFCTWEVGPNGNTVILTTEKADPELMPKELSFRKDIQEKYPYLPIGIGISITMFVIISSVRIKNEQHKK